jgi:hypothetical protein
MPNIFEKRRNRIIFIGIPALSTIISALYLGSTKLNELPYREEVYKLYCFSALLTVLSACVIFYFDNKAKTHEVQK